MTLLKKALKRIAPKMTENISISGWYVGKIRNFVLYIGHLVFIARLTKCMDLQ